MLTTDYLTVTDADALARLLDLAEVRPEAVATRVFHDPATSFHPKAYLFSSADGAVAAAFVGSNNLSASGIAGGIEWAVGADQVAPLLTAFERLWSDPRSQPLTHELLADYRRRWRPAAHTAGVVPEPPATPPAPWPVQREALTALEQTRLEGFRRGLAVMATGLGKTWLAAFDTARPQFRRVLFVAHREEILRQSLGVFRRVQPAADLGLYYGGEKQPDARVLFASIQTLAGNLHRFAPDRFDYVVIDEFHHAAARSYRRVIDHFQPTFLLGLTATPNRMDGADLLALCSDNLVYECPLTDGHRARRSQPVPLLRDRRRRRLHADPLARRPVRPGGADGGRRDPGTCPARPRRLARQGRRSHPRVLRHRHPRRLHGRVLQP